MAAELVRAGRAAPRFLHHAKGRETLFTRKPQPSPEPLFRTRRRRRRGLRLDVLEDRIAPATVTWNNAAGGDWDTVSNWTDNLGVHRVPGASDNAVIGSLNSGASVTHTTNASDSVMSIMASAPIGLSKGTLTVSGSFSDSSMVTLAGATLANATIAAGTALNATASSILQDVSLQSSSVTVTAGKLSLTSGGSSTGSSFSIGSGATLGFDGAYALDSTSSVTGRHERVRLRDRQFPDQPDSVQRHGWTDGGRRHGQLWQRRPGRRDRERVERYSEFQCRQRSTLPGHGLGQRRHAEL